MAIGAHKRAKPDWRNLRNARRDLIINVAHGHLPTISERAWEAVLETNDPPTLFRRGSSICRIIQQDDGPPTIEDSCQASLRGELARRARWVEITKSEDDVRFVDKFPPLAVMQDMLVEPRRPLPVLQRIVEAPVFGSEGTLQTSPGYHEGSQNVYYANELELKAVSKKPSLYEIEEAKKWILEELFGEFPFASKSDQLHAVAAMMGPFVREMIKGPTSLHLVVAPSPGTGKSLLADALTIPATDRTASTLTEGGPEEEWRKKITAILMTAPPFVLIDNVRQKIDSPSLAAALTSMRWEDRLLGRSEIISLPVQTTWLATGNNPSLTTEMARRTMRIRLDAKVARPWQGQEFRHPNLRKWAVEHQNELVWSILTLIQAWVVAGKPAGDYDLGQYESWAAVMGGTFDVIKLAGFLHNLDGLYEVADEETAQWEGFVSEWWASFSNRPVGISQLFDIADDNDHLITVRGFGNPQSQKTKLGRAVSQMHERHLGGYIVKKVPHNGRGGTALYRLRQAKNEPKAEQEKT